MRLSRETRDRLDAGFGLFLLGAGPVTFIAALATGEWRWLLATAICVAMLATKQ